MRNSGLDHNASPDSNPGAEQDSPLDRRSADYFQPLNLNEFRITDWLSGADRSDPGAKIPIPTYWELYGEKGIEGRLPSRAFASLANDATFSRVADNELFDAHRSLFDNGLRVVPSGRELQRLKAKALPNDELIVAAQVLEKLEADFRSYLKYLATRLDSASEDQRSLIPRSIWIPGSAIPETSMLSRHLDARELDATIPEIALKGVFSTRLRRDSQAETLATHELGQPRSKVYTFLARVLNEDGMPIIAFDTHLNCHGFDPNLESAALADGSNAPSSLIRVYKRIPEGGELDYLRSTKMADFAAQFLFSPESFQFELAQLVEGAERWFTGGAYSYRDRRPYLAKVLEYALLSANRDLDIRSLEISEIRPDPVAKARNVLLVDHNDRVTCVTLAHSASPSCHNPTYMVSYESGQVSSTSFRHPR